MAGRAKHSQLQELDRALGEGRTEDARRALLDLSEDERAVLQEYLGREEFLDLYKAATRRRRGPSLGRVVVLPGLMGTNLDSVDASGDADRVWFNIFRMIGGRVSDLRLGEDGQPLPAPPSVRTAGIHSGTYLKLLFELQAHWDTIAFGYDWRADVRQSAAALAERIREWAKGEPVHLVAHSMGGILARTFIRRFPDAWAGMQDRTGKGRGGRLVMLGTPNRGAFAIVLALSGDEKLLKMLATLDRKHDLTELLQILNTFPGSYQLLPSPRVDLGDDHRRLFDAAAWGSLPVRQGLLRQGEQFQEWLHPVIDPDRLVFVAGYGQPTPVRVRIEGPGRFTYDVTDEGDGRVPHSLGLLEDVRTYWVKEKHGDLARNKSVLQAMHLLLQTGETLLLESARPRVRAAAAPRYRKADTFETVPPEMEAFLTQARGRRDVRIGDREAARIQAHLFADYLGSPGPSAEAKAPTTRPRAGAGRKPSLEIEVLWSDIREAGADVNVAGAAGGTAARAGRGSVRGAAQEGHRGADQPRTGDGSAGRCRLLSLGQGPGRRGGRHGIRRVLPRGGPASLDPEHRVGRERPSARTLPRHCPDRQR
jgi:pimeloyl-ACP methyl ester carboxylesterase